MTLLRLAHVVFSLLFSLFILTFSFFASSCVAGNGIAPARSISVVLVEPEIPKWKHLWDKARAFVREKDYIAASKAYAKLFQLKPNIEEANWEYCKVLLKLENFSAAPKVIGALLEKNPNRHEYLLAGGLVAFHGKDFAVAAKLYGKAFEQRPFGKNSNQALEGLVNSLRKNGKKNFAFPLLEQLCLREPANLHLLHSAALDAQLLGKKLKAVKLYTRLLRNFKTGDRILFQAAKAYEAAGLKEKSAPLWEEYLDRHPNYMVFRQKLVNFFTEKKDYISAIVHLSYLALNLKDNDDYLIKTANMYLHKLGRPDKALLFYEKYIVKHPDNKLVKQNIINIQSILANDFLSIVENDGAWLLWKDLARVTPNRRAIYFQMAELLEKKGMKKDLIDILTIIYHHSPKDEALAFRIAEQFFSMQKNKQALNYLLKIKYLKTKAYFLLRGRVEMQLGREKSALASYESALSLDKEDIDLRQNCLEIAGSIGLVTKLQSFFDKSPSDENELPDKKLLITYLDQLKRNFLFEKYYDLSHKFIEKFAGDSKMIMQLSLHFAAALQKEGKPRKAEQLLRKLLNYGSSTAEILYMLTENALKARNAAAATTWYNALKELISPGAAVTAYNKQGCRLLLLQVKLLKLKGRYGDAKKLVQIYLKRQAVEKKSENMDYVLRKLENELCWLFFYTGDYKTANDLITKYFKSQPFDDNLFVLWRIVERKSPINGAEIMAEKLLFVGKQPLISRLLTVAESELLYQEYGAAEKHLQIILKNVPGSLVGRILQAKLFFAQGKFTEAADVLSLLSEAHPKEQYFYSLRIEIEVRRGKYDAGLKILTGSSSGLNSHGQIVQKLSVGNDIEGELLLARLLWGNNQHEKCLEIYKKLLAPGVITLLSDEFARKQINFQSVVREDTFWNSLFLLLQSEPEIIAQLMEPSFLLENRGNEAGKIVADNYELYSWQKLINAEYLARKAIFRRNYIYAEQSYKKLIEEEGDSSDAMIDLASLYGRFGKYRKEAQVYKALKETGTTSPQLTHSMERNTFLIRPRSSVDAGLDQQFGRDGHINMSRISTGTSFWFTPELNKDFKFTYSNEQYDAKDSDESAESNLFTGSATYELGHDYEMVFGAGVNTMNGNKDSSFMYSVECKGQLDKYVTVFLKGEKKLVFDTVQAVKDQISVKEVSTGINYETPFGLTFGGDLRHRQYNDGNSQNKFHGFSSLNYFYDSIYLSLQYDYRYVRSEKQNILNEDTSSQLFISDDLPYWSPNSFREHSLSLHFQHNFLGYQIGSKRGLSYYSIDNTIGYEEDEVFSYRGVFNIFLEMNPHFLLKSNFTFSQSDVFEEKGLSLSLLYRW